MASTNSAPNTSPRAGRLYRRITLQEPVQPDENRDQYGQPIQAWATVADVWANVEPLSGRELWHAQQVQPDVTHRITIRYARGRKVGPEWRAIYNGRTFNFLSVLNLEERNRTLQILAMERV